MTKVKLSAGGGSVSDSVDQTGLNATPRGGICASARPQIPELPTVEVSRDDVDAALSMVASNYPELERCMVVARALLCRLDTIRDEAKFGIIMAKMKVEADNAEAGIKRLNETLNCLGNWHQKHSLNVGVPLPVGAHRV